VVGARRTDDEEHGMNKRSAMLMAAGLILTLIIGGVAMSVGLTGPTPSEAGPRAERRQTAAPIIKTVKHTLTVHKRGSATQATGTSGSSSAGSVSGSIGDDHSGYSDDAEGEDHGEHGDDRMGEDDDHGDDHSGEADDDHSGSGHGDDRTAS
jgi:hypothetical protein